MKPIIGTIISDKMTGAVTIEVMRQTAHPLYHKRVWSKKKYHARNELEGKVGDRVKIIETRPQSKTIRWQAVEVMGSKKVIRKKTKK